MTEYRVKRDCFFLGSRYRKGAIVSLPAGAEANEHFEAIDPAAVAVEEAKPTLSIMHRGNGKWAVVNDLTGEDIESGLTKIEAQIRANEGV